jgi:DNA-directed RNA polymerase subunit RPC12/RpoP
MKQKTTIRDILMVLVFGATFSLLWKLVILIVASLVATMVWWLADVNWLIALLFSYLGINLALETLDVFQDLRGIRCPKCKRRIKTSRAIKCTDCGGRAELTVKRLVE